MADTERYVDCVFYVQFAPEFQGRNFVRRVVPKAITQNKPHRPRGDASTLVTKLTLRMPESVFLPLEPEAVIVIRPGQTHALVELSAEDVAGEYPDDDSLSTEPRN